MQKQQTTSVCPILLHETNTTSQWTVAYYANNSGDTAKVCLKEVMEFLADCLEQQRR